MTALVVLTSGGLNGGVFNAKTGEIAEGIAAQAEQSCKNVAAIVEAAGATMENVVKTTFNQRRKTLRNSIKPLVPGGHPLLANEIFNKRPEQLSVADFVELTKMVKEASPTLSKNEETED